MRAGERGRARSYKGPRHAGGMAACAGWAGARGCVWGAPAARCWAPLGLDSLSRPRAIRYAASIADSAIIASTYVSVPRLMARPDASRVPSATMPSTRSVTVAATSTMSQPIIRPVPHGAGAAHEAR